MSKPKRKIRTVTPCQEPQAITATITGWGSLLFAVSIVQLLAQYDGRLVTVTISGVSGDDTTHA